MRPRVDDQSTAAGCQPCPYFTNLILTPDKHRAPPAKGASAIYLVRFNGATPEMLRSRLGGVSTSPRLLEAGWFRWERSWHEGTHCPPRDLGRDGIDVHRCHDVRGARGEFRTMPSTLVVEPGNERMHASTARSTRNGRTAHSSPAVVRGAAPVGAAVGTSDGATPAPNPAVGAAGQEAGLGSGPPAVGYLDRRRLGAGVERIKTWDSA